MKNFLRTATIVLGLVSVYGFVAVLFIWAWPHFTASSDRPGSEIIMFVVGALPELLGAAAAGLVAGTVFPEIGSRSAIALAALIAIWYAGSSSMGWHFNNFDAEGRIGWILSALLVGSTCFASYFFVRRRSATTQRQPAPSNST